MTIPTYEELMLPLLRLVKDGRDYSLREATEALANEFHLTDEEKTRMLPSGTMTYVYNRIGWAKTSLKKANLLEQTGRGLFKITQRGLDILKENPPHIDVEYLLKFPEFAEFQRVKKEDNLETKPEVQITSQTPEDMITTGYELILEALSDDLLEKVKSISSKGFELLVLDLCKKMNYGNLVEHVGKSGDEGIDGIIKEDRLGLSEIYLQAKKWDAQVGSKEIQGFVGALQATRTKKGIFITTSDFTPNGRDFVKKLKDTTAILINGRELAKLMVEYNVGVSEVNNIKRKKIDQDYFDQYL
jgi:restriction system protein